MSSQALVAVEIRDLVKTFEIYIPNDEINRLFLHWKQHHCFYSSCHPSILFQIWGISLSWFSCDVCSDGRAFVFSYILTCCYALTVWVHLHVSSFSRAVTTTVAAPLLSSWWILIVTFKEKHQQSSFIIRTYKEDVGLLPRTLLLIDHFSSASESILFGTRVWKFRD